MRYFDIYVKSMFNGESDKIIFPFKTREEAIKEMERRFPNKNGWELEHDEYEKNIFYYDWMYNPSYEIYIREF